LRHYKRRNETRKGSGVYFAKEIRRTDGVFEKKLQEKFSLFFY
jgi:hypothetical protein